MNAPMWIPEWVDLLGWVLVHFLWQGAIIGAMAGTAHAFLKRATAQMRYAVLCAALAACGLAPCVTWLTLQQSPSVPWPSSPMQPTAVSIPTKSPRVALVVPVDAAPTPIAPATLPSASGYNLTAAVEIVVPYLAVLWGLGVLLLSLRLLYGWTELQKICATGSPLPESPWPSRMHALAQRMGIDRAILLLESARVEVPTVIGWLKPVLIVPATFFSALPADQIEAILAHELAHIRRHDYLVNLIQILIETLLFYHPAVWWISRTIRQEREHCCDDLAVQIVGDKFIYATALAALEESRSLPTAITLAATGGSLLERIRRVVGLGDKQPSRRSWFAPLVVTAVLLTLLAVGIYSVAERNRDNAEDPFGKRDLTQGTSDEVWEYKNAFRNAVMAGKVKLAEAFLRHGIKIEPSVVTTGSDDILADAIWRFKGPEMVRMLLAHGAKPGGDVHDARSTINCALKLGNKEVVDLLIAAGAVYDPVWYDAALGQLDDLKKRDAHQPLDAKEITAALDHAVDAGQVETFDWLWQKSRGADAAADVKRLDRLYSRVAEGGHLPLMLHLEQIGVKPADGGVDALESAVGRNHVAEARHLFEKGVTLPKEPYRLRNAAGEGKLEMVKLLLDHGADVNALDTQGMTPLCWAAYLRQDEVCRALIDHGADVTIADDRGHTAAWYAVQSNLPDTLDALIKKGARLDVRDKQGFGLGSAFAQVMPPLPGRVGFPGNVLSATEQKKFAADLHRTVALLVAAHVNLDEPTIAGENVLEPALADDFTLATALLDNGVNFKLADEGYSALEIVGEGDGVQALPLDLLQRLLAMGAKPGGPSGTWAGVLEVTFKRAALPTRDPDGELNARQAVRILLDHGAQFAGHPTGPTRQLFEAAARGDLAQLRQAVQAGASVDAADGDGWTALTITLALGYEDCTQWLLQSSAKVATKTNMGYSPLWFAVIRHQEDRVAQFLSAGADPNPNASDSGVDTPLYWAARNQNLPIFRALIEAGAKGSPEIVFQTIRLGQAEMARLLLDHGAPPDLAKPLEHRASAYWAVYYHQPEIFKLVAAHGADLEMKTDYNETPLSFAQQFHKDMVPIIEEAIRDRHAGITTRDGPTVVTVTPIPPQGIQFAKIGLTNGFSAGDARPWVLSRDGKSFTANLSHQSYNFRVLGRTADGRLFFSPPQVVKASGDAPLELRVDTTIAAIPVTGKLDDSVPRPVKNGHVIVAVSTPYADPALGWFLWNSSAEIHPDGTFELPHLPPPQAPVEPNKTGPLELIAVCDGYVSKDPAKVPAEYAVGSQVFAPPLAAPLTIAMEPLHTARVRIVDPHGKPIPGALVRFAPNERFHWMSTLLGSLEDDEAAVFGETRATAESWQELSKKYEATTDSDGVAVAHNLPPGLNPYTVISTTYDVPYRLRLEGSPTKYAQNGVVVAIAAGQQASAEMKLIPKIAPIQVPNSQSPDGKYVVSIEPSASTPMPMQDPQTLVIREAKTGQLAGETRMPYDLTRQFVDLVTASDPLKAEWDAKSSFFVFSVRRKDHMEGVIVVLAPHPDGQLSNFTTDLPVNYVPVARMQSYEFVGARDLKIMTLKDTRKLEAFYYHVGENGQVSGRERPFADDAGAQNTSPSNPSTAFAINGSIKDETGRPIPNATVLVNTARLQRGSSPLCPYNYAGCGRSVATDAQGAFTIPQLPNDLVFQLLVAAPGYVPQYANDIDSTKGAVSVALHHRSAADLQRGVLLHGQVVDATGKPVASALVSPYCFSNADLTRYADADLDSLAVTAADGRFSLLVAKGYTSVGLEISATGLSTRKFPRVSLVSENAPLALDRGVTVTGRLVREGKPVSSAQVGIADSERRSETFLDEITAETGADGRFTLNHVASRQGMTLYAKRDSLTDNGVTISKLVSTGAPNQTLDVGDMSVVPGRDIHVRVALADGKPVPAGLHVLVDRPGAWDVQSRGLDQDGGFHIAALDGKNLTLTARIDGYALTGTDDFNGDDHLVVGPASQDTQLLFAAKGDPNYRLIGKVVNAQGQPAVDATVALFYPDIGIEVRDDKMDWTQLRDQAKTNPLGEFSLKPPKSPKDILFVKHPDGYALVSAAKIQGAIKLTPWAKVEGTAWLGEKPAAGKTAMVSVGLPLDPAGDSANVMWVTANIVLGADGKFVANHLPEGHGGVELTRGPGNLIGTLIESTAIATQNGQTLKVTIGGKGAVVTGSLDLPKDPDFNPQWDQELWSVNDLLYRHYYFEVQPDGSFRVENVPPGQYNLAINFRGRGGRSLGSVSSQLTVAAGQPSVHLAHLALLAQSMPSQVGDAVPAFALTNMTGKPYSNADLANRVTLLRFNIDGENWGKFFNHRLVDFLQELGSSDRLRVVSFEKTPTRDELETYDKRRQVPWDECWIGDAKGDDLTHSFHISNWPSYLVVGPDGKIRAIGNSPDEVKAALLMALAEAPPSAPTKDAAANSEPSTKTVIIHVQDETGKPVAGATLEPKSIMAAKNATLYLQPWTADSTWPKQTDASGNASVSYPAVVPGSPHLSSTGLTLDIIKEGLASQEATLRPDRLNPVVLSHGTTLTLHTIPPTGIALVQVFGQISGGDHNPSLVHWTSGAAPGTRQVVVGPGTYQVRTIGFDSEHHAYFSPATEVKVTSSDPVDLSLHAAPATSLRGKLDPSVPRPIRHGTVVVTVSDYSFNLMLRSMNWTSSMPVAEDGTFEVSNLPPGVREVIALCDGHVSRSPSPHDSSGGPGQASLAPQLVFDPPTAPVTVSMQRTGIARVRVLTADGKPISGAKVTFIPQAGIHAFGFTLGQAVDTETAVRQQEGLPHPVSDPYLDEWYRFEAATGADGYATVENLPPGNQRFFVTHNGYDGPLDQTPNGGNLPSTSLMILPGSTTDAAIKLAPKTTAMIQKITPRTRTADTPAAKPDVSTIEKG